MAKKNVRNMKVCGQSGYKYETVPAITLKGKWLEELGFHLGDYVQVKCENGQLTSAFYASYNNSFYYVTFFNNAAWCCIFDRSNDYITNVGISSCRTTKHTDTQ